MNCTVCGTEITNPAAVFCPNCGARLNAVPQEQPAPATEPVAAEPMADAEPLAAAAGAAAAAPLAAEPVPAPQPQPAPQAQTVDPRQNILFNEDWAPIVKIGDWLGTLLILTLVPMALAIIAVLVGRLLGGGAIAGTLSLLASLSSLILMFYFAFAKRFNPSKRNFFKAALILTAIMLVLLIILVIVLASILAANPGSLMDLTDMLNSLPY